MPPHRKVALDAACGDEVVCGFRRRIGVDDASDSIPETTDGAFGGLSQICLELGEGVLDRVEVGAVERKIEERRVGSLYHLTYALAFLAGEVVHDDDGVVWQLGDEHFST